MDIYEAAQKSGLSLSKLRHLQKLGILNVDKPENKELAKAMLYLRQGRDLSTLQLLMFLREPENLEYLNHRNSRQEAMRQLASLGNLDDDFLLLPIGIIDLAASPMPEFTHHVITVAEWLKKVIPAEGCRHQYLAVRALHDCPISMLGTMNRKLANAFANARKLEGFAGWFKPVKERGRWVVEYQRGDLQFDL